MRVVIKFQQGAWNVDTPRECYVAFLDIMGFAKFVENNTSEFVLKYLSNFTKVNAVFDSITPNINTSVFSDTIAIYTPTLTNPKEDLARYLGFLRYVGVLQYQSITAPNLMGLPLCGAVTKGEFYSNNKDILFGKAWVEAFYLERDKAVYPRVIVKKEANDFNCALTLAMDKSPNHRGAPLRQDSDGELHCNYLNNILDADGNLPKLFSFILDHKNSIEKSLIATEGRDKIHKKYRWLMEYHNWFCSGFVELKDYHISD